jgi:hypothetical protein
MKDSEYVAEFRKVTRSEPEYKVGISGDKIVQKLQNTPEDIRAFIKKYTENK